MENKGISAQDTIAHVRVMLCAKAAVRLARAVAHAVPRGVDGPTAAQWVIPSFNGENPEIHHGPPGHYLATVQAIARAVIDSPEALRIVNEWGACVTPRQDPLRFVNKWR